VFASDMLQDRVIVVTGGGTGLGKSMALRFAELGAKLVLTSRRQEVIDAAAGEVGQRGAEALAVPCDIRQRDQVDAVVAAAVERFGTIDGLVNNAAGNFLCPSEELSPNGFQAVVDIVLNGTFHCTQAVGKQMIAQGTGGNVLSITTTYADNGSAFVLPSACAKAGVLVMMRSLAVEWARHSIRCNAIAPGPFPTEGAWSKLVPDMLADTLGANNIPAKRFGEHHELANLAAFLMSDAAPYLTGQQITIDGGTSLMAGDFNMLTTMDPENVAQIMRAMRPSKK
jgi:NAD(P)-dependent dehydrogenase (short-subunit alcohol dehydrogenase family)